LIRIFPHHLFSGGTMKVFGDGLNPSMPYETFLLSVNDTAEWVVKEMLEKYGLKHEDPLNYCLLQVKEFFILILFQEYLTLI
jgi:hypothetical protein